MRATKPTSWFARFTRAVSRLVGRPAMFLIAVGLIALWLVTGPLFDFSNTWQLMVNTGTTIVTFLMVFLIQSSQNRDAEAVQVKLDELIRVSKGAHIALLDLEELEEADLDRIRADYAQLAQRARDGLRHGHADTGVPEVPR